MRSSSAQGDLVYIVGVSRSLKERQAAFDAEREVVGAFLYDLPYLRLVQFTGLPVDDFLSLLVVDTEFPL